MDQAIPFAEQARRAARRLGRFTSQDLENELPVNDYADRQKIRWTIHDFLKRGEAVRVDRGIYQYKHIQKRVTYRQRLWNAARRMKGPEFTLGDLEQLTGIAYKTIQEFCGWLVSGGYAERIEPGIFKRTCEYPPLVPQDARKNQRLADWRRRLNKIGQMIEDLAEEMTDEEE